MRSGQGAFRFLETHKREGSVSSGREPTPEEKRLYLTAHTILCGLEEFRFGYEGLLAAEQVDADGSVRIRYHLSALTHYLAGWFLLDKKQRPVGGFIEDALLGLGVDEEIAGVRRALGAAVGASTVGDMILSERNKVFVHPKTLVPSELIARAESKFGAAHDVLGEQFPAAFQGVCEAIGVLEAAVRRKLPEGLWPPDSLR